MIDYFSKPLSAAPASFEQPSAEPEAAPFQNGITSIVSSLLEGHTARMVLSKDTTAWTISILEYSESSKDLSVPCSAQEFRFQRTTRVIEHLRFALDTNGYLLGLEAKNETVFNLSAVAPAPSPA